MRASHHKQQLLPRCCRRGRLRFSLPTVARLMPRPRGRGDSSGHRRLACLRRHEATPIVIPRTDELPDDLPDYPTFEANDFGAGVLHVENLLKISPFDLELPDSVTASAVDQDLARTTLGEIARTLPLVSKHTLRRALGVELGLTDAQLNLFLGRHGRELLHHVTTSSSMRTRLREITGATAPTDAAKVAAAAAATLAPFASSQ